MTDDRNAFLLLNQLERILESDPRIDEIGFIHPSQFAALDDSKFSSNDPLDTQHDYDANFWNRDHKLAISTQVLFPLYKAAKLAFTTALKQYKLLITSPEETDQLLNKDFLENEVMNHSKALLLLSSDYATAWNSRKLVTLKKKRFPLLMEELLLSSLILSYAPKSEYAWSHRRWAIKTINGEYPNIEDIIERESKLVEKIAEKSKMNYHAWNHRCWLVTHMTREQGLNELNKSRKWAESHVADNSCFHYRQRLLDRVLEHSCSKYDSAVSSYCMPDGYHVWVEELDWNEMLIRRYIGREALWVYRRFLSQFGIKHFSASTKAVQGQDLVNFDIDNFINGELQLLHACLTISDNKFEDCEAHGVFAASYILWVSKEAPNSWAVEFQDKLMDLETLKTILNKLCPEKTLLWNDLTG